MLLPLHAAVMLTVPAIARTARARIPEIIRGGFLMDKLNPTLMCVGVEGGNWRRVYPPTPILPFSRPVVPSLWLSFMSVRFRGLADWVGRCQGSLTSAARGPGEPELSAAGDDQPGPPVGGRAAERRPAPARADAGSGWWGAALGWQSLTSRHFSICGVWRSVCSGPIERSMCARVRDRHSDFR